MRDAARIKIVVSALFSSRFCRLLALPSFAPPQNCQVYRIFMGMWPQQTCGLNTSSFCRLGPWTGVQFWPSPLRTLWLRQKVSRSGRNNIIVRDRPRCMRCSYTLEATHSQSLSYTLYCSVDKSRGRQAGQTVRHLGYGRRCKERGKNPLFSFLIPWHLSHFSR